MPIVTLKMWPGRTEAERMACAKAVATAITETLENMENEPMIVSVLEMPADELDEAATAASKGNDAGTLVDFIKTPWETPPTPGPAGP